MLASGAHWARKLDLEADPGLFDALDQRVRRRPRALNDRTFTGGATLSR